MVVCEGLGVFTWFKVGGPEARFPGKKWNFQNFRNVSLGTLAELCTF